jgi:hypothetical protein
VYTRTQYISIYPNFRRKIRNAYRSVHGDSVKHAMFDEDIDRRHNLHLKQHISDMRLLPYSSTTLRTGCEWNSNASDPVCSLQRSFSS